MPARDREEDGPLPVYPLTGSANTIVMIGRRTAALQGNDDAACRGRSRGIRMCAAWTAGCLSLRGRFAMIESTSMSKVSRRSVLQATGALSAMPAAGQDGTGTAVLSADDVGDLPRVKQDLVGPPLVPKHEQVAPGGPVIVEVELVAREVNKVVDGAGTEV